MQPRLAVFSLGILVALIPRASTQEKVVPTPIVVLNTPADEDNPHHAGTGQLFFTRNGKVYLALRGTSDWLPAKIFRDLDFKASMKGLYLYAPKSGYPYQLIVGSNASDPLTDSPPGKNYDLVAYTKLGVKSDFTQPSVFLSIDTSADECDPWLSSDGSQLFFSRRSAEGWQLLVSSRPKVGGGPFAAPVKLDFPVGFHHATLTSDGRTMFLEGPIKGSRSGIFRSQFINGKWTDPEALDELNHPDGAKGECSPALSRDGSFLYFASDRPGGQGGLDLYFFPVAKLKKGKE